MGIHGIYKEIGPGRRVALCKFAVDIFEKTGRPLRIAIDTSIWLFQIQAGKGGTNPALRTFYYRLLRLVALDIHPVFVFDGPNKPPFKRNKRTGVNVASIPEFFAKQLLKQFGFPIHLAPGEAEAECALLQREGIVDAVLSEDVDTLMFGSGVTIRNWSPYKTGTTPTHVNVYDAVETKNGPSGLDREGMILVALMSGGDYVPEGIPGCGPKTACEAAKAGFGAELCKIPRNDTRAMSEWRQRLQHELKTNESKLFKRKHGTLKIPEDFPRLDILGYYTHPAISTQTGLDQLRRSINWDQDLDFPGLREFTKDAFEWARLEGAKHFIRSLAPSLLVRSLRMRGAQPDCFSSDGVQAVQENEALLVKGLHGKRQHEATDHTPEIRVSFIPIDLVSINLDNEEPDLEFELPPDDGEENPPLGSDDEAESGPKARGPTKFDPHKPARMWVLESIVKLGVPLKVENWEAGRQTKLKPKKAAPNKEPSKAAPKAKVGSKRTTKTTSDAPRTRIDAFAKVTKPGSKMSRALAQAQSKAADPPVSQSRSGSRTPYEFMNLLSSSPVKCASSALTSGSRSPSPELVDLPASVTKRRKRGPIQRARTLPSDTGAILGRPGSPSLDEIDTLDLLSSPIPSRTAIGSGKSQPTSHPPVVRISRSTSVASSPGKVRQTTLDTWRASASPSKQCDRSASYDDAPIPTPSRLRHSHDLIDTLDLTLSSPSASTLLNAPDITPVSSKSSSRPPLASVPKATRSSTRTLNSSSSASKPQKAPTTTRTQRTSPRLRKDTPPAASLSPSAKEKPTDLTSPKLVAPKSLSPEVDSVDLTDLSSPVVRLISPQAKSTSSATEPEPAPAKPTSAAAWKAKSKKKREIILRKSLAGAWDYAEVDSPKKDEGVDEARKREKDRRRWRESAIEVLDLT